MACEIVHVILYIYIYFVNPGAGADHVLRAEAAGDLREHGRPDIYRGGRA